MHSARSLVAVVALTVAAPAASAQTVFRMLADGMQENPQNNSPHTGEGTFFLDPGTGTLSYDITITGVTGTFTAAHIHLGAPGVNGGVIVPLSGGPGTFQGSAALTSTELQQLAAGDLYCNFHSTTFPGGEIRGQIAASNSRFAAVANGAKETPPNGSSGLATGVITLNPDLSLTYEVDFSGFGSGLTSAHVHDGKPGVAGGIITGLQVGGASGSTSGSFSGTTLPLAPIDAARIRAGHTYLNLHTTGLPGGEVRGQVVASFTEYGSGCNGGAALSGDGVPSPGETVALSIAGGAPNASPGLLFVGFTGDEINFAFDCTLAMKASPLIPISMPPLDGAGALTLPAAIPSIGAIGAPICLPLQYFGADASQPGGYFTSNGLQICIDD